MEINTYLYFIDHSPNQSR